MKPPIPLPLLRPQLYTAHVDLVASTEISGSLEPWMLHDYVNLVVLPVVVFLSLQALCCGPRWQLALTRFMLAYIVGDGIWIGFQPSVVRTWHALMAHHIATAMLLIHPLTHTAHLRFVAWMTIVEANTLLLLLRRHARHHLVEMAFVISWIAIRALWFPYVALHVALFAGGWPAGIAGHVRHALVSTCIVGLAALQLIWTRDVLRSMRQRTSEATAGKGTQSEGANRLSDRRVVDRSFL